MSSPTRLTDTSRRTVLHNSRGITTQQEIEEAIANREYERAAQLQAQLDGERQKRSDDTEKSRQQRHSSEMSLLEDALSRYRQMWADGWQSYFDEFEAECTARRLQLQAQQQIESDETDPVPVAVRWGSDTLALRNQESELVRQKRFDEATTVREQCIRLETRDQTLAEERANAATQARFKKLEAKHQAESNALESRLQQAQSRIQTIYQAEKTRVELLCRNARENTEHAFEMELMAQSKGHGVQPRIRGSTAPRVSTALSSTSLKSSLMNRYLDSVGDGRALISGGLSPLIQAGMTLTLSQPVGSRSPVFQSSRAQTPAEMSSPSSRPPMLQIESDSDENQSRKQPQSLT